MFSQKDFIAASRNFVCVRLESYESEAHQKLVRSFLSGRFANTAFCILSPDGKTRLSGSGRSPGQVLVGAIGHAFPEHENEDVIAAMKGIAKKYPAKAPVAEAVVQDFHSFRQALNVAAGDQRLLLVTDTTDLKQASATVQAALNHADTAGRFHADFIDAKVDTDWRKALNKAPKSGGYFIIQADAFGQKGSVLAQLPLSATSAQLKQRLLAANTQFAQTEKRKVYSEHVATGRRTGVYFKNGMPYGEDRDGDGVIDHRGGQQRRSR